MTGMSRKQLIAYPSASCAWLVYNGAPIHGLSARRWQICQLNTLLLNSDEFLLIPSETLSLPFLKPTNVCGKGSNEVVQLKYVVQNWKTQVSNGMRLLNVHALIKKKNSAFRDGKHLEIPLSSVGLVAQSRALWGNQKLKCKCLSLDLGSFLSVILL